MAGYKNSDYFNVVYATTSDTYFFYRSGTNGTLVATVLIVYSDTGKTTMTQVTMT